MRQITFVPARTWCHVLVSFIVALTAAPSFPAATAAKASAQNWITEFQRYAEQKNIQDDRMYAAEAAPELRWREVLQALPEPAQWEPLQRQLSEAAQLQPEGMQRQRLLAGAWLFTYLRGDRDGLLAALPAAAKEHSPLTPVAYATENLRRSLAGQDDEGMSLEKQVRLFEEQLAMLEPVDVAEVKHLLGGEEGFARLHRLLEASKAMQAKVSQVYAEYEKNKDEAAARTQMEALQKQFDAENAADEQAMAPYITETLVQRYVAGLYRDKLAEDQSSGATLPDLVKFLGPERAEVVLRRALKLPLQLAANEQSGDATSKLAQELALAEVENLKVPSWGLATNTQAVALFEALQRRFGAAKTPGGEYDRASGYYLGALIEQGRVSDALQFASQPGAGTRLNLPSQVLDALEHGGKAEALWEFLRGWLSHHPSGDEWDRFTRLSAQLDRQHELKALIALMAADGAFVGMDRVKVQRMQADAELAADDLTAAATRLRTLVQPVASAVEELKAQMEIAEKLIQLADLQKSPDDLNSALTAAHAIAAKCQAVNPQEALELAAKLTTALNRLGRFDSAVQVSRDALTHVAALKVAADKHQDGSYLSDYTLRRLLSEQLRALVELGHWAEAESLIEESPWWGAKDASALLRETVSSDRKPLGWHLARVAQHRNQNALARRILEAQLVVTPGADAVYASYLELVGKEAQPLLSKLAAVDHYEERPLIWQAQLLLDAKEWDKAVTILQTAITIDPSDGEEGPGDRMRVYALMARAKSAQGEAAKATIFEGVVKAIRLSETADRWFEVGAYARAIRLYREALSFFQDAYCIQSRLAVRLAGEGRMDEAAEHYRRAFELMPDSFGRVESHCFGCEHVFAGEKSQGVAEKVFTEMLAARPDKPQLHYLMGYLRQQQQRAPEAAEHFRKAVALDPLYLNAWDKLAELERQLAFTAVQRDELSLKLLELDPARRHATPDLSRVKDLAKLWRWLQASRLILADLPTTDNLWELKASAVQSQSGGGYFNTETSLGTSFGAVLNEHRFVQAIQEYLAALNAPPEES